MSNQANLVTTTKRALRQPPKIVSAYLDGSNLAAVSGGGGTVALPLSPAGGSFKGWWGNGTYLIWKEVGVAIRDNAARTLTVLPELAPLFEGSELVKGLTVVAGPVD